MTSGQHDKKAWRTGKFAVLVVAGFYAWITAFAMGASTTVAVPPRTVHAASVQQQSAAIFDLPRPPRVFAPAPAAPPVQHVSAPVVVHTHAPAPVPPVPAPTHAPVQHVSAPVVSSSKVSTLISFLRAQVGKPYVFGGNGPGAYDCSGLVVAAFRTVGIQMPRTAADQASVGVSVSLSNLQPGDVLFWGSPATHSAIYIGGGRFIAAENERLGVVNEPMTFDEPQYARRVL